MQDFLKRDLHIDDYVILINPSYRRLLLARVTRFTETGNGCYVKWGESAYDEKRQSGDQLVKVEGPDLTMYMLKK